MTSSTIHTPLGCQGCALELRNRDAIHMLLASHVCEQRTTESQRDPYAELGHARAGPAGGARGAPPTRASTGPRAPARLGARDPASAPDDLLQRRLARTAPGR